MNIKTKKEVQRTKIIQKYLTKKKMDQVVGGLK